MAKRRHISIDVEEYIFTWALRGKTPAQIHEALSNESKFAGRVPTLRTVQTRVKQVRPPDPSGRWSFAEAEPDEARIILDALAELSDVVPAGAWIPITNDRASWLLRLRTARPDLGGYQLIALMALYQLRARNNEATPDLDAYLALAPWRGADARRHYRTLVELGSVPALPEVDARLLGVSETDHQFDRQIDSHVDSHQGKPA